LVGWLGGLYDLTPWGQNNHFSQTLACCCCYCWLLSSPSTRHCLLSPPIITRHPSQSCTRSHSPLPTPTAPTQQCLHRHHQCLQGVISCSSFSPSFSPSWRPAPRLLRLQSLPLLPGRSSRLETGYVPPSLCPLAPSHTLMSKRSRSVRGSQLRPSLPYIPFFSPSPLFARLPHASHLPLSHPSHFLPPSVGLGQAEPKPSGGHDGHLGAALPTPLRRGAR
jgi:hypothetical protein